LRIRALEIFVPSVSIRNAGNVIAMHGGMLETQELGSSQERFLANAAGRIGA